jgi:V8-like Glu-specific endopeptidase
MVYSQKPLKVTQWRKELKQQRASRASRSFEIVLSSLDLDPRVARSVRLRKSKHRVEVVARKSLFSQRVFPPDIRSVDLKKASRKVEFREPEGFRPKHLDFRAVPKELDRQLRQLNRVRPFNLRVRGQMGLPSNVFSPDDRYTFSDTAFPWSTCGRVDTAAGWGSGAMIGPRHLMTASHVVNWGPNNTAGWLKFTPLYFDGNEPFGHAWATRIYWWLQANPSDGINADECAFDYVVCVLDQRMGDITGWMGSRGYDDSWDGGNYWGHIGYPNDLAGGQRPAFIGYQAMDSTFTRNIGGRDSFGIQHKIDVIPGQSGGPYFGWWSGEPWPRVVATQSAQQWGGATGPNTCGGGNPLPELISYALNVEP